MNSAKQPWYRVYLLDCFKKKIKRLLILCLLGCFIISTIYAVSKLIDIPDLIPQQAIMLKDDAANSADKCTVHRTLNRSIPDSPEIKHFIRNMNDKDMAMMKDILYVFTKALKANNVSFHMASGTLLGSYLHHGFIPWDDDLDVIASYKERERIVKALAPLQPNYVLFTHDRIWKFWSVHAKPFKNYKWSYPYIDIFFYKYSKSGMVIKDELLFAYDLNIVFPVVERPFFDMNIPAPKNTEGYLKIRYNLDKCPTNLYNHRVQKLTSENTHFAIPCSLLYWKHPFVFRCTSPSGRVINETLWIGDHMLSWVALMDGRIVEWSPRISNGSFF